MSSKKCTAAAAAAQATTNAIAIGEQMSLYSALLQQFQTQAAAAAAATSPAFAYSGMNPYAAILQNQLLQVSAYFSFILNHNIIHLTSLQKQFS